MASNELASSALHILSLGAGVQSTTMALMAAHGEITPMPDLAIFADTQAEPKAVYEHLEWLRSSNVLPFPVEVVTAGDLGAKVMAEGYSDVPWHTLSGLGRRQCTKAFKLYPIRDKAKEWAGVPAGKAANLPAGTISMWIGISLDEVIRMKPASVQYINNRWPLIELKMSRNDCLQWMKRHDYPEPPRSACVFCPYRKDHEWRSLPQGDWERAVEVDAAIRTLRDVKQYAHRTLKPLSEVDLSTAEDHGQGVLFGDECEGMCGV
jgi:hypothetical protein